MNKHIVKGGHFFASILNTFFYIAVAFFSNASSIFVFLLFLILIISWFVTAIVWSKYDVSDY